MQTVTAFNRVWVAAIGPIPREPVGIQKNQRRYVGPSRFEVSSSLVDGVLDNRPGVPAAGDDDIEMKMEAMFLA